MQLWQALLNDESGFVVSSEAVLVGTVGVLGATVGLSVAGDSIHDELTEVALAFRSLDQSYSYEGIRCGTAWTAGSAFQQPPVAESQAKIRARIEQEKKRTTDEGQSTHPKGKNRQNAQDKSI